MRELAYVYLGKVLFDMYREKHPEVTERTLIEVIDENLATSGFQITDPLSYSFVGDMPSPIANLKRFTVLPEYFEKWAEGAHGTRHKMAYLKENDTIYVFSYTPTQY